MADSLYNETGLHYNDHGRRFSEEIEEAIRPVIKRWIEEGFHQGEMRGIAMGLIPLVVMGTALRHKLEKDGGIWHES